jgi:hypothetical protein
MNRNRLIRPMAVAVATLAGLALFFLSLRTAAAQAAGAGHGDPNAATAQVWHVAAFPGGGAGGLLEVRPGIWL